MRRRALAGRGIVNKPRFEKLQDPKVRLLLDFVVDRCQGLIRDILAGK